VEPAPSPFLKGDNAMEERPFSDISYEQYLKEEKLMGSRCKKCGALFVPPRSICIKCYSSEMEWVEIKGEGRLHAFTCIKGVDATKPEEITIGIPLKVKFLHWGEGENQETFLAFQPG
jgi:uncharacterized OB-fold protein